MKRLTILIFIIAAACQAWCQNALADSAYNRDQYGEAVRLYTDILARQGRSPQVYYNLGNAYYRQGKVAQAVLSYERALRLDPTYADARTNLAFLKTRLEDKPEQNNSFFSRAHDSIVQSLTANAWAWIAALGFAAICGAAALYIFSGTVILRKIGFFGGLVLIPFAIYLIVVASDAAARIDSRSEAIVTAPSTFLNSQPRQPRQTEKVVPLHEGTKVQVIDSIPTPDDPVSPRYYKVRINGSTPAWLRASDVEII